MRNPVRVASLTVALGITVMSTALSAVAAAPSHACRTSSVSFDGWKAQQITNDWVSLTIVPQLGGRLMQVAFAGHDFLFVNPKYKGKYIPPSQASGRWINYGGDKVWPLPEGNGDDHHWVLRSDQLDDGEYSFRSKVQDGRCSIFLEGPPDPVTGLQYSREIAIRDDSPTISFHAVMKNISDHPIEWSMQSVSQYDLSDQTSPDQFNREFYAFTPVNRHSAYFSGYQVRSGLADDPSFEVRDGLFRLHWLYLQNEVWLDSPAGWLAVLDRASHYAMVERFTYHAEATYPGKASVIFYKNGAALGLDDKSMPKLSPTLPSETPYYMEAELNSPMVSLRPGENYAFDTTWLPTRTGSDFNTVTEAGIVEVPLTVERNERGLLISATLGVFYPGTVHAHLLDAMGRELADVALGAVSPVELVKLRAEVAAMRNIAKVSLRLEGTAGVDRGILCETEVKQSARAGAQ